MNTKWKKKSYDYKYFSENYVQSSHEYEQNVFSLAKYMCIFDGFSEVMKTYLFGVFLYTVSLSTVLLGVFYTFSSLIRTEVFLGD